MWTWDCQDSVFQRASCPRTHLQRLSWPFTPNESPFAELVLFPSGPLTRLSEPASADGTSFVQEVSRGGQDRHIPATRAAVEQLLAANRLWRQNGHFMPAFRHTEQRRARGAREGCREPEIVFHKSIGAFYVMWCERDHPSSNVCLAVAGPLKGLRKKNFIGAFWSDNALSHPDTIIFESSVLNMPLCELEGILAQRLVVTS